MALLIGVATTGSATAQLPVLRARSLEATAAVKIFNPAGSIRLVGWDRDSIVVRGRVARGERFFFGGSASGVKLGLEDAASGNSPRSELVIYLPRASRISAKSASADITGTDVSGWFYSVTGSIRLAGSATSIEAETMDGNIVLDVAVPWVRARTGNGTLTLRRAATDADLATIAGTLNVATASVRRGRFSSVTGDIRMIGTPPADALLELSNHEGAVDLLLPRDAGGVFDLSTVGGTIENTFAGARPAARSALQDRALRVQLGGGGAHVTVRTFRGAIRLRSQ
jgi:DUF4097 and DUF4098 domain-containing protein YvlB